MKTVTRSLLLSYNPISNDQLVELYCRRAEVTAAIYSKQVYGSLHAVTDRDDQIRIKSIAFAFIWLT